MNVLKINQGIHYLEMNNIAAFLKKALKIILWVMISFLLLFIVAAIFIQIPAVQTKLADYAVSFIGDKTHTRVDLKNISLSFPKSLIIEGIYLEDTKKDTLLYAGETKVNISFSDLINHKINVSYFELKDVNLLINRQKEDSIFNYNFLITAFSDTTQQKKAIPKNPSPWLFNIENVSLNNIKLHYDDKFGGMNASADLKKIQITINQINFDKSIFNIEELLVENLNAEVLIKKIVKTTEKKSESILPKIAANKIQIKNSNFIYADSVGKQSVFAGIYQLSIKDASVDIQGQTVDADNIALLKSKINYSRNDNVPIDSSIVHENKAAKKSGWKVSLKGIDMDDISASYNVVNKPEIKKTFDAFHLDYKHLTLAANNIYYSSEKTGASIKKFTAVDKNNFSITKFETDFSMDKHSITAKKLIIKTNNSLVDADMGIKYSSLKSLNDSIQLMITDAEIKYLSIKNYDILYFYPQLIKQAFFKNEMNITSISGLISGPLNNLKGINIVVKIGINTILKTDFTVSGLPSINTADFNFPNLRINSGRKDIDMITGYSIPKSIDLPENISMHIAFRGQIKSFESTVGISSNYGAASLSASIDNNENFRSRAVITNFDLGSLLKNRAMLGTVSLIAETDGKGFDKKNILAAVSADVSQIYFNKYNYHNLNIDGNISGQEFEGKIRLSDENASLNFDGLVNLNPNQEHYRFHLNLNGADLQKLNFTKDDIRIGFSASADMKGGTVNEMNGKAEVTNIIIAHQEKKYILDSLLIISKNEPNISELTINSAVVGIKYSGAVSPISLPKELGTFINSYFPFIDSVQQKERLLQNFNFEIELHNHPIISELLLPQLKEFTPGIIHGNFDKKNNELKLTAKISNIIYGTNEIKDLVVDVTSDTDSLNYKIYCSNISNSQIKLDNIMVKGKLADNKIFAGLSSMDSVQNKKLTLHAQILKNEANYKLNIVPNDFYIMNERWDIAADNYIEFGKQGFLIHHLFINKAGSQVSAASVHDKFSDDINIAVNNFKLDDISRIIEKDTSLVKGNAEGNLLLKRVKNTYGITADAKIGGFVYREVPIGDLYITAANPSADKFNIDLNLSGTENNLKAKGYFIPQGGDNSLNITAEINKLSMNTVRAFSQGNITEASGNITGNFLIEGKTSSPEITGELSFNNTFIKARVLNNKLQLKHETIHLKKDGIYFKSFTILDPDQHTAVIDGTVKMENFQNLIFALNVNTKDFLLFNTTAHDNKEFFGRMIIDSKIDINGSLTLPSVNAKIKMKNGSNFTFAVPEEKLTISKGEDVVKFGNTIKHNYIIDGVKKKEKQKSGLTGFDLSSIIEIDKEATLRLLIDPSSSDSLVVKGEAAMSFAMDRSGKISLTGAYNINDGSYLVSLESVIKRKFIIDPGSTIIWGGDPLDAEISINAVYSVRASPIDLVADQMTGLSEIDKNNYKQRYPFLVLLKLRGNISHPEISFEIQLPPEDKGILSGAVNAKLNMLNEDPSLLNKQVFALLVLGRFIQENPLQTETNGVSAAARTTVGKFLSEQLNQFTSKSLPGVELNFDIQSYDDYQSGQAVGRTKVDIGIKKQLFNERLTVQVGGAVDVEGEKAKQNSAGDIASDVTVEYKITEDGRYRLKGFRHNQYEGAIEGQLIETGAGVLYVRDFTKWRDFFRSPKIQNDSIKSKQQ